MQRRKKGDKKVPEKAACQAARIVELEINLQRKGGIERNSHGMNGKPIKFQEKKRNDFKGEDLSAYAGRGPYPAPRKKTARMSAKNSEEFTYCLWRRRARKTKIKKKDLDAGKSLQEGRGQRAGTQRKGRHFHLKTFASREKKTPFKKGGIKKFATLLGGKGQRKEPLTLTWDTRGAKTEKKGGPEGASLVFQKGAENQGEPDSSAEKVTSSDRAESRKKKS